jgi:hypothetical protein
MSKPKLGSGKRFEELAKKLEAKGKSEKSAKAITASVGRAKLGSARFQKLAARGRKG